MRRFSAAAAAAVFILIIFAFMIYGAQSEYKIKFEDETKLNKIFRECIWAVLQQYGTDVGLPLGPVSRHLIACCENKYEPKVNCLSSRIQRLNPIYVLSNICESGCNIQCSLAGGDHKFSIEIIRYNSEEPSDKIFHFMAEHLLAEYNKNIEEQVDNHQKVEKEMKIVKYSRYIRIDLGPDFKRNANDQLTDFAKQALKWCKDDAVNELLNKDINAGSDRKKKEGCLVTVFSWSKRVLYLLLVNIVEESKQIKAKIIRVGNQQQPIVSDENDFIEAVKKEVATVFQQCVQCFKTEIEKMRTQSTEDATQRTLQSFNPAEKIISESGISSRVKKLKSIASFPHDFQSSKIDSSVPKIAVLAELSAQLHEMGNEYVTKFPKMSSYRELVYEVLVQLEAKGECTVTREHRPYSYGSRDLVGLLNDASHQR